MRAENNTCDRSKLVPLLAGDGSFLEQHARRRWSVYARENVPVELMARRTMCKAQAALGVASVA